MAGKPGARRSTRFPQLFDPEWLSEHWLRQPGLSYEALAAQLGCSRTHVILRLKKLGFPSPRERDAMILENPYRRDTDLKDCLECPIERPLHPTACMGCPHDQQHSGVSIRQRAQYEARRFLAWLRMRREGELENELDQASPPGTGTPTDWEQ